MSYAGGGSGGGRNHHNNHNSSNNYNNNNSGGGRNSNYRGGGGGGRYQGSGGRGRGGGGRGNNTNNSSTGGGGRGNNGIMQLCRDFTSTGGQCPRGTNCPFKHVIQLHATIMAATKPPIPSSSTSQQQQGNHTNNKHHNNYNNNSNNNYNNSNNNTPGIATVTSIAIWEQPNQQPFKIFTSSTDGYWRLWNTAGGQFIQEFENNMAGIVHKCFVSYDHTYLFCGFAAICRAIPSPDITVGMVHGWNLQQPSQPPLELQIQPSATVSSSSSGATTPISSNATNSSNNINNAASSSSTTSIPYAHNMAVSALHMIHPSVAAAITTSTDNDVKAIQIVTGSRDGSIRCWGYRNGIFTLIRTLCGHAREVTGLVLVASSSSTLLLWSASIDHCIRIWNLNSGDCQYCITGPPVIINDPLVPNGGIPPNMMNNTNNNSLSGTTAGHTMPITALIPYISPAGTFILSASLDRSVKVWNAITGECVASEVHNDSIICMTIARDIGNHELLLLGMENGSIQCRNISPYNTIAAFQLLFTMNLQYTGVGHDGPVKCITAGPSGTFYSGGMDGKMLVYSFCGDLGLNA